MEQRICTVSVTLFPLVSEASAPVASDDPPPLLPPRPTPSGCTIDATELAPGVWKGMVRA